MNNSVLGSSSICSPSMLIVVVAIADIGDVSLELVLFFCRNGDPATPFFNPLV